MISIKRKFNRSGLLASISALFFGTLLVIMATPAQATPAFARSTGASCNKCHTINYPQLTFKGENFKRNGFQLRKKKDIEIAGIEGDNEEEKSTEKKKIADDLYLNRLSELMALYGKFTLADKEVDNSGSRIARTDIFEMFVSGTVATNIPIWVAIEYEDNEAKVEDYYTGMTNIGGKALYNIRVGRFDPTSWTSFSAYNSAALYSASSKLGSYRGKNNFTKVGAGYDRKSAIEYYGYTDRFLWSAAIADGNKTDNGQSGDKDYWLVGRYNFSKIGSLSALYYSSQVETEDDIGMFTVNGALHFGSLDLWGQYSQDDSGKGDVDDVFGYTLQADYKFIKKWMGVLRYDVTDNGLSGDSEEAQATIAAIFAPLQNIKFTASFVTEVEDVENSTFEDKLSLNFEIAL